MKEVAIENVKVNPVAAFGDDWMALSAGSEGSGNAMCVAWGHLGCLWGGSRPGKMMPTAVVYVRPQRYTREFMEREPMFALCEFGPEYKKALGIIGSRSERDGDKLADAGLTPVYAEGTMYLREARRIYICRKVYHSALKETCFTDESLVERNYPERDFHEVYIGEIVKVLEA